MSSLAVTAARTSVSWRPSPSWRPYAVFHPSGTAIAALLSMLTMRMSSMACAKAPSETLRLRSCSARSSHSACSGTLIWFPSESALRLMCLLTPSPAAGLPSYSSTIPSLLLCCDSAASNLHPGLRPLSPGCPPRLERPRPWHSRPHSSRLRRLHLFRHHHPSPCQPLPCLAHLPHRVGGLPPPGRKVLQHPQA